MPSLTICNRGIALGSDDFTLCWNLPTYLYHPIWLGLLLGAWHFFHIPQTESPFLSSTVVLHKNLNDDQKLCVSQARTWLTASLCFCAVSLATTVATHVASSRGPIFMEPVGKALRDCWVGLFVVVQLVVGLLEFAWGVTGVIVYTVSMEETAGAGRACLMLTPVGADLLLASCIFVLSRRVLSLFYFCSCVVLGSAPVKNTTAWHKERDA